MLRLAWTAAVSFSALPLRLSFFGAGIMTILALEEAVRAMIMHFSGKTVQGWTSIMVVLCLSNGAYLWLLWVFSVNISEEFYEEGKARPLYVIVDTWNLAQPGDRQETGPTSSLE